MIIQDLPEKVENKYYSYLSPKQASLYQSVVNQMIPKIDASDGIQRKGMILAAITKLKQICDHPNLVLETPDQENIGQYSGKMDQLIETLSRIQENNQKVIIFTQYIEMGKILQRELSKAFNQEIEFMYGGILLTGAKKLLTIFRISCLQTFFLQS